MLVAIKSTFDALLNLINGKADITYVDSQIVNVSIPSGSRLANIQSMNLPNGQIIKGGVGSNVSAFDIDSALNNKANASNVYTKAESDGRYYQKSQVYTKAESDGKYRLISDSYTKAEVDSKVGNYATQAEATAGTVNNKLMSPLRVKESINTNRPYATKAEAEAGTNNTKMMTPLRVKEAITNQVVGIANLTNYYTKTQTDNLLNNKVNISQFNKAGIGLGNVENYGIATQAEAIANNTNIVNNKYMTPVRVVNAIDERRKFATLAETNSGTSATRIISPLRLKEQLNLLSAYVDNKIAQL